MFELCADEGCHCVKEKRFEETDGENRDIETEITTLKKIAEKNVVTLSTAIEKLVAKNQTSEDAPKRKRTRRQADSKATVKDEAPVKEEKKQEVKKTTRR